MKPVTFDRTCPSCDGAVTLHGVETPPPHRVFVKRPMLTEQRWTCPWCGVNNSGRFYATLSRATKKEPGAAAGQ